MGIPGQGEEYAIAGVLWDLLDGKDEAKKDSAADKSVLRKVMAEQFAEYDSNSDGVWDQSEFFHSLVNQQEYNGNFDQYFDERELMIWQSHLLAKKSEELVKKCWPMEKKEPGSLMQMKCIFT